MGGKSERLLKARRPVGPSYNEIGGGVVPNITTPPDTLFNVRLPQLASANRTNILAFKRVNSVPAAPKFSGSAASVRPEPGSVNVRVPAISVANLWRSKAITVCDLLKLDCEGAEVSILHGLAATAMFDGVRLIVGEWHATDDRPATIERLCCVLREVLDRTHEVEFRQPIRGREGHFTARPRETNVG